jgi:hypothetical protein
VAPVAGFAVVRNTDAAGLLDTAVTRGRRRIRLLALALATVAVLAAPASANAFEKGFWWETPGLTSFDRLNALGVQLLEIQLHWSATAPQRPANPTDPNDPAYHWPADVDQAVRDAQAQGMDVAIMLISTPSWANGGKSPDWAPTDVPAFADFAAAASQHYATVHRWLIWGEANKTANFQPEPTQKGTRLNARQRRAPHLYARLLDAAYGSLKAVSRQNMVIGGATWTVGNIRPQQWVQNLKLPNGKPPRLDEYSHNPFSARLPSFRNPPLGGGQEDFSDLKRFAHDIDKSLGRPGNRHPKLFLSEFCMPSSRDYEFAWYTTEEGQAQFITAALRLARGWSRIDSLVYIHMQDTIDTATTGLGIHSGLIAADGRLKPAWAAFMNG